MEFLYKINQRHVFFLNNTQGSGYVGLINIPLKLYIDKVRLQELIFYRI